MLTNIPTHKKIFIDSNIFIYHFLGNDTHSESCTNFINNVEEEILQGYTSSIILAEVLHRFMVVEAIEKFGTDIENAVKFLKRHPLEIKKLTKCFDAVEKIEHLNIVIFPPDSETTTAKQLTSFVNAAQLLCFVPKP